MLFARGIFVLLSENMNVGGRSVLRESIHWRACAAVCFPGCFECGGKPEFCFGHLFAKFGQHVPQKHILHRSFPRAVLYRTNRSGSRLTSALHAPQLSVVARDNGFGRRRETSCQVLINLSDENDNSPAISYPPAGGQDVVYATTLYKAVVLAIEVSARRVFCWLFSVDFVCDSDKYNPL